MNIIDQTLRQLVRNRVHDITDLADEISEQTRYAVDVDQSGLFGGVGVTIHEPTGSGEDMAAREPISVSLPSASHSRDEWLDVLEGLEDIAQQLRAIRHMGISPCA